MVDACAHMIVYISIMARYTAKEDDPYDPTLSYVCGSVIGLMSMALRRFAIAHFLDVISMMQLGVVAALLCRKQIELPTIPAKPTNGSCTSRH
jgi:hypothetical protein